LEHFETVKIFEHCRLIVGMVLSLALARLLNGIARFVQHPKKVQIYSVHLGWVFTILIFLVHFWWWEFKLVAITQWTFEAYLLVIVYAIIYFLLCALLFPDQMDEYTGFEDYFTSRRKWFFGIFALTFAIDVIDTMLKGEAHFHSLGIEYPIRIAGFIALSIAAMFIPNARFQKGFVLVSLLYELSFIFRLFHTQ
jgi:hypothetical protein